MPRGVSCAGLCWSGSLRLHAVDPRNSECVSHIPSIGGQLSASVIMVAFNEPLSTVLRSLHSLLDRTAPQLLHEIILVDDASDVPWFGRDLEVARALGVSFVCT
jgi:hypothetical protein